MENVEKSGLGGKSAKKCSAGGVEERGDHPQIPCFFNRPRRRCAGRGARMWIKNRAVRADAVKKARLNRKMNNYAAYTGVCSGIYPQNQQRVDEFPQELSTCAWITKRPRKTAFWKSKFRRNANKSWTYPQIVQYLWITSLRRAVVMKQKAYTAVFAAHMHACARSCKKLIEKCSPLTARRKNRFCVSNAAAARRFSLEI